MKRSIFCSVLRHAGLRHAGLRHAGFVVCLLMIVSAGCTRSNNREKGLETEKTESSTTATNEKELQVAEFPDLGSGDKALLVGCTRYPNLPDSAQLNGPINDVELIRKLLVDRFELDNENIVTLSESSSAAGKPTRQNIQAAFSWIQKHTGPGDSFVFFFAGHGTQVPDIDSSSNSGIDRDREPDGLDEALLPRDAMRWDRSNKQIQNAISDDQLKQWLDSFIANEVATWVIVDACHSGTAVRSQSQEKQRKVTYSELGIPESEFTMSPSKSNEAPSTVGLLENSEQVPKLAAIYAALPSEPTPEFVPKESEDDQSYGLLTHTLCRVLTSTNRPLTYESLAQKIRMIYRGEGRHFPTPIAEGTLANREILGRREFPKVDEIVLMESESGSNRWLNAGIVNGFQTGTVFEVYQSSQEDRQNAKHRPVAAVRITSAGFYQSEVEPCQWSSVPNFENESSLQSGQICKPVFIDFGDRTLKVALSESPDESGLDHEKIRDVLGEIASDETSYFSLSKSPEDADWIIAHGPNGAELVPAKGWIKPSESGVGATRFGPIPLDDIQQSRDWLSERFRRIAQASNLVRLSGGQTNSEVDVTLRTIIFKDQNDLEGEIVRDNRAIELRSGEYVAFEAENHGSDPVDVSMLFVDSAYGITALFPRTSVLDNRITGGNKARSPRFQVESDTAGIEQVVMIAVSAENEPISFGFLEQPSLEQTPNTLRALDTPLGNLIKRIQYREGNSRGLTIEESVGYAVHSVSWTVKP